MNDTFFRIRIALGLALMLLAPLAGCTRDQPTVVAYISADEYVAREVIAAFEQETGINVEFVGDTEVNKTTGLVQRLRAEADNPQADVFWSSEVFQTIELADEGVFEPYQPADTDNWPSRFRDDEHRWWGFAARARVICYNPQRVSEDELPQTWMALTQPQYSGRIVMADPRFGTTGGHLGAMKTYWASRVSPGFYEAWLQGLADNDTRYIASGNAGVVRQVINGEADFGMTDTDDVWAAQANGQDVELVYPRHEVADQRGTGTLLIPNTVALIRDCPNPELGRQLVDFLLSERVERILAESNSHNVPIRPGLAEEYRQYDVPNPLNVGFAAAAAARSAAVEQAIAILSGDLIGAESNEADTSAAEHDDGPADDNAR